MNKPVLMTRNDKPDIRIVTLQVAVIACDTNDFKKQLREFCDGTNVPLADIRIASRNPTWQEEYDGLVNHMYDWDYIRRLETRARSNNVILVKE